MATRQQFIRRVRSLGCTLTEPDGALLVDAPRGMLFRNYPVHCLRLDYRHWRMPDVYAALLGDMSGGLEACDDPNCDMCTEANEVTP